MNVVTPSTVTEREDRSIVLGKKLTRDELMKLTSGLIRILHKRTTAHKFKPSQHDSPRLQYARACIAAIQAYGTLLKDDDLIELEQRIELLEKEKRAS
jgi:hypothetical protein